MERVNRNRVRDAAPEAGLSLVEAFRARLRADSGAAVELVATHISWVLLTDTLAYKIKKPVHLAFVDFGTLALRRHYCEEELRLNRRLAASLYLAVVPLHGSASAPTLQGEGEPIEYAVCMKRFAPGALACEQLRAGTFDGAWLEGLARRLAEFHRSPASALPLPMPPPASTDAMVPPAIRALLDQLQAAGNPLRIAALRDWFTAEARAVGAQRWRARAEGGAIRECHGDLHLGNVVLIDGELVPFDCIEFDQTLRQIDVMSEVAFLTMDFEAHGRSDLASRFLDAYLQHSGDPSGVRALRFHEVYRALVRALVGSLTGEASHPAGACHIDYLAVAESLAFGPRPPPRLLITHGFSGSGKSTVAQALAQCAEAIRLRSDVERKRLFGLPALASSRGAGVDIYSPEATRMTFDHLREGARELLQAGRAVIVDAAFLQRSEREAFHQLAVAQGAAFTILDCQADTDTLRRRVLARVQAGKDASEATVEVLERQLTFAQPLTEEERRHGIAVSSGRPIDIETLAATWLASVPSSPRPPASETLR
ncbi:bifunctional aminoglycoside phosphotransferase/ATP-binding protein [soil metagenome]